MTNVSIRRGGSPASADAIVSTDGSTILGDGTARNPLHTNSQVPSSLERVTAVAAVANIDADVDLSFVYAQSGVQPANCIVNLPDGTIDGQIKQVILGYAPAIDADYWRLTCTLDSSVNPSGYLQFAAGGGGATLGWDDEEGFWSPLGSYALA